MGVIMKILIATDCYFFNMGGITESVRRFSNIILKHCNATMVMTCHTDYGHFLFGKGKNFSLIKGIMSISGYILYRKATRLTVPSEKAPNFPFVSKMKNHITVVPNGMCTF